MKVIENEIRSKPPHIMNVLEVAYYTTLSKRSIWSLVSQGKLRATKIGGRTIFKLADVEKLVN